MLFLPFFLRLFFAFVVITNKPNLLAHLGHIFHSECGDFEYGIILGSDIFDVSLEIAIGVVVIGYVDIILVGFHSLEIHDGIPHQCDKRDVENCHRTFDIDIG